MPCSNLGPSSAIVDLLTIATRLIDLSEDIQAIGWKAQVRLCQRYRRLAATGKPQPKVTTAIARELVGYAWDIARRVSPAVAG